jgi:cold-inducible RNA-binding protein
MSLRKPGEFWTPADTCGRFRKDFRSGTDGFSFRTEPSVSFRVQLLQQGCSNVCFAGFVAQDRVMSKNIFVGSLAWATTSEGLEQAFAQFGTVTSAKVITDRETGRSKGFGFVEMESGADEAINALNGSDLDGRQIVVNEARPREPRSGGGYGGGGGRGRE